MTDAGRRPARLEFVLGRADDLRAEAYVRLVDGPPGARITGSLAGPRCRVATTLPVTLPLGQLAGAGAAVARAVVTEPGFWTPELPNLYDLVAEARDPAGAIVAATREAVGLRRLGVRGRSIWLDGRRWVPRGTAVAADAFDLPGLHAEAIAAVIDEPAPSIAAAADAAGVAIVAVVAESLAGAAVVSRVAAWARHPSVVMVVLGPGQVADVAAGSAGRGTLLVGCGLDASRPPPDTLPAGSDCLVARLPAGGLPHEAWRRNAPAAPILAWRPAAPARGRAACDLLQAELAAWGCAGGGVPAWDWAGYLAP